MGVLISVIIPYYNSAKYLEELLCSIDNSSDIEVIVVNDHSNKYLDEYQSIIKKYDNSNISFYDNDDNKKGAGTARNKGVKISTGKYLLFADADDIFLPNTWDKIRNLDLVDDVIFFPPISKRNDGSIGNRHQHYYDLAKNYALEKTKKNEAKLRWQYWSPCSKLVKRELVISNNIMFDSTPVSNDDMFSTLIGLHAKKISAVNYVIYQIREHGEGISNTKDQLAEMIRKKVYCRCYKIMKNNTTKKEKEDYLEYRIGSDLYYFRSCILIKMYEFMHGKI